MGSGMGSHGDMGGSGMGSHGDMGQSTEDWGSEDTPMCCPTKKIWGSKDYRKDGIYDLVMDYGMGGNGYGMGSHGSGMGGSHEFRQDGHGDMGGSGMGSHGGMGGSGNGGHGGMGYGGMGYGNMGGMEWPERCGRNCVYTKRNSNDGKMYCFARSQYSMSQCVADDGYGMGNEGYGGSGMGSHGNGMGSHGSGMGSHGSGMGSHGSGMGSHGS